MPHQLSRITTNKTHYKNTLNTPETLSLLAKLETSQERKKEKGKREAAKQKRHPEAKQPEATDALLIKLIKTDRTMVLSIVTGVFIVVSVAGVVVQLPVRKK